MSFITKQLLAQAVADRDSLTRTIAAGGDSAELQTKLRGLTKHLDYLSKQLAAEEAKMQQAKASEVAGEEAKKAKQAKKDNSYPKKREGEEEKPKKPRFEDKTLQCCDCEGDFIFSGGDQAFFARNDFAAPVRCADCRAAKKAAAPKPITISCKNCKVEFMFSVGAQKFFKENNWPAPVRCTTCRKEKKAKSTTSSGAASVKSAEGNKA
jgi:hypothetical protein